MIFRLDLTHQPLAAYRIRSRRDRRRARLILYRLLALQTFLVQALLVTSNIVVALRFEVRRKPVHLSNSLIAGNPGKIEHSNTGKKSQSRNPRAVFHFIRILAGPHCGLGALSDGQKRGFFVAQPQSKLFHASVDGDVRAGCKASLNKIGVVHE